MNILEYENYHENIEHVELAFPYNTYLCSIPLDFQKVPLHWHDEIELIYIKKGKGIVSVDFRPYKVSAPTIVLILPGQLHSIEQCNNFSMEYENIIFSPNMLISKNVDYTASNFLQPLFHGKISVPTVFTPVYPYYKLISAPLDACDEICKTMPQGYQLFIKSKLYEFFFILDNRCRNFSKKSVQTKNLNKLKTVLKYVENHYPEKITIAEIADIVDFSESHFMRYFKETMGTSFVDYLNEYRLTMSARLLQSSESSILNIAAEVGFENVSYFNRAFKKKYGITPTEYRKTI